MRGGGGLLLEEEEAEGIVIAGVGEQRGLEEDFDDLEQRGQTLRGVGGVHHINFTHRFPTAVKQPAPDCEGMTNTVFYQFDVKKSVRHKVESSDYEAGCSGNVRLFVNYTGLADKNAFSHYRYALLAIGYPSTSEGEDAIRQVLYGEIELEPGDITSLDIRMQRIYAAFEQVVQH